MIGRPYPGEMSTRHRLRVFAVEDTTVQLTWSSLPAGPLEIRVGATHVDLDFQGGPGCISVADLEADKEHTAIVRGPSLPSGGVSLQFRTLAPPPGPELYRFATLSDMHIGISGFDYRNHMVEEPAPGIDAHTLRCTRAAVDELLHWGAQRVFLKGDITERGLPDEWDDVAKIFANLPVPIDAVAGNHDTKSVEGKIPPSEGATRAGLYLATEPEAVDLPGLRVVLTPTTRMGHNRGRITRERAEQVAALLREASTPAMVLLHHYLQVTPVAWFWPPGIPRAQATRFLRAVLDANPRTFITSGHTHRHRRRSVGPLVLTEVGSPKDYPGTWAGYAVHEGGIRQVVRRVESPDCLGWLERTRGAALGAWGRWSPGLLRSRCFTHFWPNP